MQSATMIRRTLKKLIKPLLLKTVSLIDKYTKKDARKMVFHSFPDFSDNSFALFIYVMQNFPDAKCIWLVERIDKKNVYKKMIRNYLLENKNGYEIVKKTSLRGIWHYITSKYVFFTHGLYAGVDIPKNHIVVNLWHGMPLKKIGFLDHNFKGTMQKFTYTIATSPLYQEVLSKAFQIPKEKVFITGQPRNDLLLNSDKKILKKFNIDPCPNRKIFMWMPTYRKSIMKDRRTDGKESDGFPILSLNDLEEVNSALKKIGSYMIIKLHPMDSLTLKNFRQYTNIQIIKNEDLEKKGVQLYSLLGATDALVTDYSSVFIDYLLTSKPIAFTVKDMEEFSKSRGFIFEDPLDFMPGYLISQKKDFISFLKNPSKHSNYHRLSKRFNSSESGFCKSVIDKLDIKTCL